MWSMKIPNPFNWQLTKPGNHPLEKIVRNLNKWFRCLGLTIPSWCYLRLWLKLMWPTSAPSIENSLSQINCWNFWMLQFSLKLSSLHPVFWPLFTPPIPSLSEVCKIRKFDKIWVWNAEIQRLDAQGSR
jgi:hypothetical protein